MESFLYDYRIKAMRTILFVSIILLFCDLPVSTTQASYLPFNTGTAINVGIGTSVPGAALQVNNIITFFNEYSNGSQSSNYTVNWSNGDKQSITLAGNITITFNAPAAGVGTFTLRLIQDGSGTRLVTWAASSGSVKWPGGTAPTLSTAAAAVDIVSCLYNGTNYYCSSALNFQ